MREYVYCDEDQRRILRNMKSFFLTKEEQVHFHFMMHQRSRLKSPNFMSSFEEELLKSKFEKISKCDDFEQLDYSKSFMKLREYDAIEIDREYFQRLVTRIDHPPIFIKGLIKDSKAVKEWTHEYLMKKCEDVEIIAFDYSNQKSGEDFEKRTLGEIVRAQLEAKSDKSLYINNSAEIFKDHPEMLAEIGSEKIVDLFAGHSVNSFSQLFIGNLKTWGTNWHQGNDLSCAMMLHGTKRWFFMDPRLGYILRPYLNGSNGMGTQGDVRLSLDYHRIHNPLYAYAPKYYLDLEPGDVVVFTKYWPHSVINLSPLQIMANMRMTEVNLETMKKGKTTPTLAPVYDNILNSDPDFIKFKFDVFENLSSRTKDIGDDSYFSAYATSDAVVTR